MNENEDRRAVARGKDVDHLVRPVAVLHVFAAARHVPRDLAQLRIVGEERVDAGDGLADQVFVIEGFLVEIAVDAGHGLVL